MIAVQAAISAASSHLLMPPLATGPAGPSPPHRTAHPPPPRYPRDGQGRRGRPPRGRPPPRAAEADAVRRLRQLAAALGHNGGRVRRARGVQAGPPRRVGPMAHQLPLPGLGLAAVRTWTGGGPSLHLVE